MMENGQDNSSKRTGRYIRPSVPLSTPFDEKLQQETASGRRPGRFAFYGAISCSVILVLIGFIAYLVQSSAQEKLVKINQKKAIDRINEFYERANEKFGAEEVYWEDGKSDFSPFFKQAPHEYGFYFAYFSDDLNRNGVDEAQQYVYAALPTDPEAGNSAYYVDETGSVWKGVVPAKYSGEELFHVKPKPDAWAYEDDYNRFASVGFVMSRIQ
ncbi:MAG: hypothetical protein U5N86_11150 [Planctomycetota bacterium]|nr:hypothetical protein [Planctomycetota bacterium]